MRSGRGASLRTLAQAAAYLEGLIDRERRPDYDYARLDLRPIRALLDRLGRPETRLSVVHVAGSKGKGSTCLFVEAILGALGERVGTFTSPHLESWVERFRIDGVPVSEPRLVAAVERVRPIVDVLREGPRETRPSFFDATTAIAFLLFDEAGVDRAVIEVGLGGRLDSTNVLSPEVTAITSIGLEHTHILGDTIEAIAREKGGIIKPGVGPSWWARCVPRRRRSCARGPRRSARRCACWANTLRCTRGGTARRRSRMSSRRRVRPEARPSSRPSPCASRGAWRRATRRSRSTACGRWASIRSRRSFGRSRSGSAALRCRRASRSWPPIQRSSSMPRIPRTRLAPSPRPSKRSPRTATSSCSRCPRTRSSTRCSRPCSHGRPASGSRARSRPGPSHPRFSPGACARTRPICRSRSSRTPRMRCGVPAKRCPKASDSARRARSTSPASRVACSVGRPPGPHRRPPPPRRVERGQPDRAPKDRAPELAPRTKCAKGGVASPGAGIGGPLLAAPRYPCVGPYKSNRRANQGENASDPSRLCGGSCTRWQREAPGQAACSRGAASRGG
ncbi:MAG: hypothetical protein KC616_23515 [Myxococcales bacterium]|nr:hypothetical protein [Myxococcales bacterium]